MVIACTCFFLRNRKHLHTQLRLGIQLTIKNKIAEYISYIILHLYLQALRRQCLREETGLVFKLYRV